MKYSKCSVVVSPSDRDPATYRVVCLTCWVVMHEDTTHPEFHLKNHLTGKDPGIPLKIAIKKHSRKKL